MGVKRTRTWPESPCSTRSERENADWRPMPRSRALSIWIGGSGVCVALAFGLRAVATSQMYSIQREAPRITALSFREMDEEAINAVVDAVLQTGALGDPAQSSGDTAWFMQINAGRSQLSHLLIDLGMRAEQRRGLDLSGDGVYVVVSEVVSRRADAQEIPDVFSLSARTLPRLLIGLPESGSAPAVVELTNDLFYPGFARILF